MKGGEKKTVYEVLTERGFIEQVTDELALRQLLKGPGHLLYRF